MQTIQELRNGSAVKLTTARYFTPNGRSIQAEGIVPDITLKNLEVKASDNNATVSEKDLSGHLENPVNGDEESSDEPASNKDEEQQDTLSETEYFARLEALLDVFFIELARFVVPGDVRDRVRFQVGGTVAFVKYLANEAIFAVGKSQQGG